ncbi:MAG: hypothetical protein ACXIVQ_08235 [Acidimicrobiales bacterium]
MPTDRRSLVALAATVVALVLVVWSCTATDGDGGDEDAAPTTTVPADDTPAGPEPPPAFVPITGGTNEDGQPEPPPVHATWSVVVRASTSWAPYAGPELTGLDDDAAAAIAARLRQLDTVLVEAGVPASIELAYGPATALCRTDPGVLDELEDSGHRIGFYARSNGEAFRAARALSECGRSATTASGLGAMSDPAGPVAPSPQSVVDATSMLAVLEVRQVVGTLTPVCVDTGLAQPAHNYGTGAFTAPWRSGWTEGAPCTDLVTGQVVMIDQTRLSPTEDTGRVGPAGFDALSTRADQTLAWALDQRFAEPENLPAPGVISWGVVVWLDDLIAPEPAVGDVGDTSGDETDGGTAGEDADGDTGSDDATDDGEAPPPTDDQPVADPSRTAPLGDETLTALRELFASWQPSVESGRLRWMLPDDIAEIIRPSTAD